MRLATAIEAIPRLLFMGDRNDYRRTNDIGEAEQCVLCFIQSVQMETGYSEIPFRTLVEQYAFARRIESQTVQGSANGQFLDKRTWEGEIY